VGMYTATSVEQYGARIRWSVALIDVFLGALIWFVVVWTGTARLWLAAAATGVLAAVLIANFASPTGIVFSEISALESLELPWGETVMNAVGTTGPWKLLGDIPGLLLVVLVIDACIRLWRRGGRHRALVIGLTLGLILPSLTVHELLVDLGVIRFPYVLSFAFLAMLLVLSFELAGEVVRAGTLSGEIVERERRWSALLSEVRLLVAGLDAEGRIDYVNPFFIEVSGYEGEVAIGRRFADFVPEAEREEVEACVRDSLAGIGEGHVTRSLITASGERRVIRWATVAVRGSAESPGGILRVGTDVTEQVAAESARDDAIRELEEFKRLLEEENVFLRQELEVTHGFADIVGESDALKYVLHRVEQVAHTDATVVIEGETGVGKELVARAIHRRSSRAGRPFITVDCGSLPANLIESELFGHEKGAFTGASALRRGRFELADGGTVFLDEIGDLTLDLQVRLLRVLQEGEFTRIGASRPRKADVRVIAATNRHLEEEVRAGRFREDLFYRLHVYPITVPPLRDRREDIPLLVHHFVRRHASGMGKDIDAVPGTTMQRLTQYDWPGNVRELENVLERSVILSSAEVLSLPPGFGTVWKPAPGDVQTGPDLTLDVVERQHIQNVLESTGWKIEGDEGAAVRLGLKPSTLRSRMKKHGIRRTP
ncbi:MAG: sigma 54-interacting transcriptional regulator, partial [marine benthic group bacterium]|nr:sigma 54-interacting transcriptional regulator [Candidatus Benthicola marisminoris]